jgi:hypothetical protein
MVETPDRQLGHGQASGRTPSSAAELKAAIRETRARLASRLIGTADRVEAIFTRPAIAPAERRGGGVVDFAITTIAAVGRTKRAWGHIKGPGSYRRAAVVAVAAGIGLALAVRARRV